MELRVKVIFLGGAGVGKTSIINRLTTNEHQDTSPSIGASAIVLNAKKGETDIAFSLWDTAGQEKYRSLTSMCFKGAGIALLIYDITSEPSFLELEDFYNMVVNQAPKDVKILVVGNKCDLSQDRQVNFKSSNEFSERIGSKASIEVSAKDGSGMDVLLSLLLESVNLEKKEETTSVQIEPRAQKRAEQPSKKCC